MVSAPPAAHSQFDFDAYSRCVTDDVERVGIDDELANAIITYKVGVWRFTQTF
jgi:hypothetical protein